MKALFVLITAAVLPLGIFSDAYAWGPEGHAIVADIAEAHLTNAAEAEVVRLLAVEGSHHLDDISSWADDYRESHPETGPGHFVDIPLSAKGYVEKRDCHYDKDGQKVADLTCVVYELPFYTKMLADHGQPDSARLEALKWVVHFTGDIHQPLHAEDNNKDKGGNDVHLTYYGEKTNLHAVWDGGVIEHQFSWKLGPNYSFDHQAVKAEAGKIDSAITQSQRAAWAPPGLVSGIGADAVAWANATHALAPLAYKKLPANKGPPWEDAYQAYAWQVIQKQLSIAGVRLAEILNEALP